MAGYLPQGTALQQGRYIIGPTLGEGGFGITYQGEDARLGRKVAIKELFVPGGARNGETVAPPVSYTGQTWGKAIQNFLLEARTLAGLDYRGIVSVYDYFEQNNTAYMVMKFVAGTPLSGYISEHGGTLGEEEALGYTMQVGRALQVVHAHNLLHRDIKPSNIILTPDGQTVLVDFGAAREFAIDRSLIQTAVISAGFSPPEQFYALSRKGPYSDVFSLAATCYFMIAGVAPGGVAKQPLSLRTFAALNHALAYNAYERPQTVADFLAELQGLKPIPANTVQVLAGPLPEDSNNVDTQPGLPSFVATYAVADPPLTSVAASQLVAAPAAVALAPALVADPSVSRLMASTATTHVVARPAPRRSTNQLAIPLRMKTGEQLLPVPTQSRRRPLLWLVAAILIAAVVYVVVAAGLTAGGNRNGTARSLTPSPTAAGAVVSATTSLTPTTSPTLASSPTSPSASPTLLPLASPTNTAAAPATQRPAIPALRRSPTLTPHPGNTPRPSSVIAPTSHPANSPAANDTATPTTLPRLLPSSTPHPAQGNAAPTATFAPAIPTGHPITPPDGDGHHGGIPPTHQVPPTATSAPPTDTPAEATLMPTPLSTQDPPTLTPEPSNTPVPPTVQPKNTPTPVPTDTVAPATPPPPTPVPPTPTTRGGA